MIVSQRNPSSNDEHQNIDDGAVSPDIPNPSHHRQVLHGPTVTEVGATPSSTSYTPYTEAESKNSTGASECTDTPPSFRHETEEKSELPTGAVEDVEHAGRTDVGQPASGADSVENGGAGVGGQQTADADGSPRPFKGAVSVGNLHHNRDQFVMHKDPDLQTLLTTLLNPAENIIIEAVEGTELSVLDCDTHHLIEKPLDEELSIYISEFRPAPDAAFITHGKGIKGVFIGPYHRQRAALAALCVAALFRVELCRTFRHPLSTRKGARCGPVIWGSADPVAPVQFKDFGRLSETSRQEALRQLGLEDGKRYGHDRCPLDSDAKSTAEDCVKVLGDIVYCFRCAGYGIVAGPNLKPGVYPLRKRVNDAGTVLNQQVWNTVHWVHARYVLACSYPHFGEALLKETFNIALETALGADDPRIRMVFDKNLDFVRGEELWLRESNFTPMILENDDCAGMPGCMRVKAESENSAAKSAYIVQPLRSKFKNRDPNGYIPIRPVFGASFLANDGKVVQVQVPPLPTHKIELLKSPMSEDEALEIIAGVFSGVSPAYLKCILAAVICAERGGKPPMLGALGPTGSAKNGTIFLGLSFLGIPGHRVYLTENAEEFFRQIGSLLVQGHRGIIIDELGKTPDLLSKLALIYQLDTHVAWRPLYAKSRAFTANRAAYFFPTAAVPEFLKSMAEFNRRVRFTRLYEQVDWEAAVLANGCQGIGDWRDRCPRNAAAANALVTHVYKLCHAHGFIFTRVSETLGIGTLADDTERADPELHRNLYRLARGELPGRIVFEKNNNFVKGWVDLDSPAAAQIIGSLLDLDNFKDTASARKAVRANLEVLAWSNILGFKSPPVRCRILIHGNRWGLRFQTFNCKRGDEQINEQLPPIPGDAAVGAVAAVAPTVGAGADVKPVHPQSPPATSAATDPTEILRKGGLPV